MIFSWPKHRISEIVKKHKGIIKAFSRKLSKKNFRRKTFGIDSQNDLKQYSLKNLGPKRLFSHRIAQFLGCILRYAWMTVCITAYDLHNLINDD